MSREWTFLGLGALLLAVGLVAAFAYRVAWLRANKGFREVAKMDEFSVMQYMTLSFFGLLIVVLTLLVWAFRSLFGLR